MAPAPKQPRLKINVDKPDPTPEVIRRYKRPYRDVVEQHRQLHSLSGLRQLWLKDKKRLAYIVIVLVLLLLWLLGQV